MGTQDRLAPAATPEYVEARRHPRFPIEVDLRIYPRNSQVVRGHTVDISESGVSGILRQEVTLGEVVRLEFSLPMGQIEVLALVQQRNAFRFGFQFVDAGPVQHILERTCRQLAVEQALKRTGPENLA